jgi:hypothetical protein
MSTTDDPKPSTEDQNRRKDYYASISRYIRASPREGVVAETPKRRFEKTCVRGAESTDRRLHQSEDLLGSEGSDCLVLYRILST